MNAPFVSFVCAVTGIVSLVGFQNVSLRERLIFEPSRILGQKEWYRLFSSALLHADLTHLVFNLITLYSFGKAIELGFGPGTFLSTYLLSVLGGSLLSLYVHRNHDYSALGASGGACGVLFAAIFLEPGTGVSIYFLPFVIPGPIYAVIFLVGTFVALRRDRDNIGHDAHFGGAVVGLLIALCLAPANCFASPMLFAFCALFAACGVYAVFRDPIALINRFSLSLNTEHKPNLRYQVYDENRRKRVAEAEIDRILEKISKRGLNSLSRKERATLEAASSNKRPGGGVVEAAEPPLSKAP